MKKWFMILLLLPLLVACNTTKTTNTTTYETISHEQAKQLIDDGEVVVLDVRTAEEFATGHIPNAVNISLQELEQRLNELNKKQPYFVICRSGNRSRTASEILVKNDFIKIYNGKEGMSTWPYEIVQ